MSVPQQALTMVEPMQEVFSLVQCCGIMESNGNAAVYDKHARTCMMYSIDVLYNGPLDNEMQVLTGNLMKIIEYD